MSESRHYEPDQPYDQLSASDRELIEAIAAQAGEPAIHTPAEKAEARLEYLKTISQGRPLNGIDFALLAALDNFVNFSPDLGLPPELPPQLRQKLDLWREDDHSGTLPPDILEG